jgi:hypothetical protein
MSEIKQILVIRQALIIPKILLNGLRGDRFYRGSGGCAS